MNRLGLILFIVVKVININKNFSTIYNFARFKVRVLFDFIFDYLRYFILTDDIVET